MSQAPTLNPVDPAHGHHERAVTVHVNERPVHLPKHLVTGLKIKQEAIAQGVPIQLDFILVEELEHGRTRVIGDSDDVQVTHHSRFLANDGDDNS
jgi:Multiubiquitin